MNTIVKTIMLLCVIINNNAFAQDSTFSEFKGIIGKGVANSYSEALDLAKRDALERSVGVYISSETIIKNEVLLKDKIYSLSNGFVKKYFIVSESKISQNLHEVIISADISKDAIIDEVKKIGVSVDFNGSGLFDEMFEIRKFEEDEYNLFKSLFSNPPRFSPYTYTIDYDKPVFDDAKKSWEINIHVNGRVDSVGKMIILKTIGILNNASYDIWKGGNISKNISYKKIDENGSEYKQLLKDYQSKTCAKSTNGYYNPAFGMLKQQVDRLERKPYSPYLIGLGGNVYTVKNINTYLFLRMFYFFEFLPNVKFKIIGKSGDLLRERIINKEIEGVSSRITNEQYPKVYFRRKFCQGTLSRFVDNFTFNKIDFSNYLRIAYYDSESIDHEVFWTGASFPYLDLNCYNEMTIKYDMKIQITDEEFKKIAKIEVEGLPVLLNKN